MSDIHSSSRDGRVIDKKTNARELNQFYCYPPLIDIFGGFDKLCLALLDNANKSIGIFSIFVINRMPPLKASTHVPQLYTWMHLFTSPVFNYSGRRIIFLIGRSTWNGNSFFGYKFFDLVYFKYVHIARYGTVCKLDRCHQNESNSHHLLNEKKNLTTNRHTNNIFGIWLGLTMTWDERSYMIKLKQIRHSKKAKAMENCMNKQQETDIRCNKKCMSSKSLFGIDAFFSLSSWVWCNSI